MREGSQQTYILVLYYSLHGSVKALAREIALGIESHNIEARLRRVPSLPEDTDVDFDDTTPICSIHDLEHASALALGSPTRFGNMAASVKLFLEGTTRLWLEKSLARKPACVFTSSASIHGGQESTLLSMMLPLLHHGMIIVGLEYDSLLRNSTSGCSPYGVSHWAHQDNNLLTAEEKKMSRSMGQRLATTTIKLR